MRAWYSVGVSRLRPSVWKDLTKGLGDLLDLQYPMHADEEKKSSKKNRSGSLLVVFLGVKKGEVFNMLL